MKGIVKKAVVIFCILGAFFIFRGTAISEEINIGLSAGLTGPTSYYGIDCLHGAEIAAKEINDDGGVVVAGEKYTVRIRAYDDEGTAAKAVAGMQKLKDRYNVPVVSQNQSACIFGMMERNEKLGVLLIGNFKHNAATQRGNKLLLRHESPNSDEARAVAEGAVRIYKVKSYALLSDVGDYGKGLSSDYKDMFGKLGVKLVAEEWLDMRTQTDFRSQLTKIKAAQPDLIVLTAYDEATAGAIIQAHELGIKTPFAVCSGFQAGGRKITGPERIEGYLKQVQFHSTLPPPPAITRYFTKLYPAMNYKEPAGMYGATIYNHIHTIVRAMQKAGTTTDAWAIRKAAPSVLPLPEKINTRGLQSWNENGESFTTDPIGMFRNGELLVVK